MVVATQHQSEQHEELNHVTRAPHVAILKQINTLNDDGSYTYGFEAADGSFRVETRDKKGNVKGKFGYVDDQGEVKVVDYAAGGREGFNPQGVHLPIPLLPESLFDPSSADGQFDDEFGNDEDWNSVDADEDGNPDPPRPLSQRSPPNYQRPSPPPPPSRYSSPQVQHHHQPNQHLEEEEQYDPSPSVTPSPDPIPIPVRPTPGWTLPQRTPQATPQPTTTSPPPPPTTTTTTASPPVAVEKNENSPPIAPLRPLFPPRQIIKVAGLNKNYLPTPSTPSPQEKQQSVPVTATPPTAEESELKLDRRYLSPSSIFHQLFRPSVNGYQHPPPRYVQLLHPHARPDWP